MEGWILLGKTKKESSIMVDVWSIWIRRGLFLLFYSNFICLDFGAGRNSPECVMPLELWVVAVRVRVGALQSRMVEFAWWAWMHLEHRCSHRVATLQAVFLWIPSMESCRSGARWILLAWGCPLRRLEDFRLYNMPKRRPYGACRRSHFVLECPEWVAILCCGEEFALEEIILVFGNRGDFYNQLAF